MANTISIQDPPREYEVSVDFEEEDQVFVARVSEFPSLATHGDTKEEAFTEMEGLLKTVIADLLASGEPIP